MCAIATELPRVAVSYWKSFVLYSSPYWILGRGNVSNMSQYLLEFIETVILTSSKKYDPMIPVEDRAHQKVTFGLWGGYAWSSRGFSAAR